MNDFKKFLVKRDLDLHARYLFDISIDNDYIDEDSMEHKLQRIQEHIEDDYNKLKEANGQMFELIDNKFKEFAFERHKFKQDA